MRVFEKVNNKLETLQLRYSNECWVVVPGVYVIKDVYTSNTLSKPNVYWRLKIGKFSISVSYN